MKRSERLIRGTIVGLAVLMVMYVGAMRLHAASEPAASRTSEADLAALRDFRLIELNGDFSVEIVQGAEFSVTYAPSSESRGGLSAVVQGETLQLRGYGNTANSVVRVALPALTRVDAESIAAVSLSGFDGEAVSLQMEGVGQVNLRNNGVRNWRVLATGNSAGVLNVDRVTLNAAGKMDVAGRLTMTVIE